MPDDVADSSVDTGRFGRAIRDQFLLEPGTTFLNHGSYGAPPRAVFEAAAEWRRQIEANPDRFIRYILPDALRASAARLAAAMGARGEDLAFVDNATAGTTAVLRSFPVTPGDEVVATNHAYGAVTQTLRFIEKYRGAVPVLAEIGYPIASQDEIVRAIEARFTPRTRLLVIDHITSPTAVVFPVQRLCALAHARGIQVLVDGAHGPGQLALDIPALGADWYVGNCHKWLFAPRACAFLWAHPDVQAATHPLSISHYYGSGFTAEFDWTGTRDPAAILALPTALDFVAALDGDRMRAYTHTLARSSAQRIAQAWRTPLGAPPALFAAMATIRLPLTAPHTPDMATARRLQRAILERHQTVIAIMPFAGALWARLSAQVYNAPEDYNVLLDLPFDRLLEASR
jgi:isopenicillin-N epimerase